jgi:hypothetical protein
VTVQTLGAIVLRWPVLVFLATRVVILVGYPIVLSDVSAMYYPLARDVMAGAGMPYRDLAFAYPPLGLALVMLPALVRTDFFGYYGLYRMEMFALDVASVILLVVFLERRLGFSRSHVTRTVLLYAALGFFVGHLLYDRLDVPIALTFLGAVTLYQAAAPQRFGYYAALAAGLLVKVVPAFWFPVAAVQDLLAHPRRGPRRRDALARVGASVLSVVAVIGAGIVLTDGHLWTALRGHGARGIEIESTWATPFVVGRALGWLPEVAVESSYGAMHLQAGAVPAWVLVASQTGGFVVLAGLLIVWMLRCRRPDHVPLSVERHLQALLALTLFLIATQRVFSPQYLIWVMPALAVEAARPGAGAALLVWTVAAYALTWLVFPVLFAGLTDFELVPVAVLAVRNAVLVGLAIWAARRLKRTA